MQTHLFRHIAIAGADKYLKYM